VDPTSCSFRAAQRRVSMLHLRWVAHPLRILQRVGIPNVENLCLLHFETASNCSKQGSLFKLGIQSRECEHHRRSGIARISNAHQEQDRTLGSNRKPLPLPGGPSRRRDVYSGAAGREIIRDGTRVEEWDVPCVPGVSQSRKFPK
jgi:hypothetical protein